MKPFPAAAVTAPALEMQALWIMPDEKIIALRLITDVYGVMGCGAPHMGLAATMKVSFVTFSATYRAMNN